MPERTSYTEGTPSWTDHSSTDTAKAKAFYGALFGWDFVDDTDEDGQVVYHTASQGGKAVAGLMAKPPEQVELGIPNMWQTYISVDDLDATVAKVEPAGGQVMAKPMAVMDAGRMAVVVEPTGSVFMLWEAKDHIGAELVNEPNSMTWNELVTPDVPKAAEFLGAVLGITTAEMDMGPMGTYTILKVGDRDVGGAMNPPMPGMPPFWGVHFAVADCDATVAKAKELGGGVVMEPMDGPPGRMAVVTDDQGAAFGVVALANPQD